MLISYTISKLVSIISLYSEYRIIKTVIKTAKIQRVWHLIFVSATIDGVIYVDDKINVFNSF